MASNSRVPRVLYADVRMAYCDNTWLKYAFAGTTAGLAASAAVIALFPPRGSAAVGAVTGLYYRTSCLGGAWDEVMRAHIRGEEDNEYAEYPQPPVGFWNDLNKILADEEAAE